MNMAARAHHPLRREPSGCSGVRLRLLFQKEPVQFSRENAASRRKADRRMTDDESEASVLTEDDGTGDESDAVSDLVSCAVVVASKLASSCAGGIAAHAAMVPPTRLRAHPTLVHCLCSVGTGGACPPCARWSRRLLK